VSTRRLPAVLFVLAYATVALALVRHAPDAVPSLTWMYQFDPGDYPTLGALGDYLWALRTAVPPVISTAEILATQWCGDPHLVTGLAYRAALVLVYVVATGTVARSLPWLVVALATSVVFLWTTVIVHAANPQSYDAFYPLAVLLFVAGLGAARTSRFPVAVAAASGFFLSMAELARPFFLLLLPMALGCAAVVLRDRGRKVLVAFVVPVLVCSGAWHAKLLLHDGQLSWSNHAGFNLVQAWPDVPVPRGEVERTQPKRPGLWRDLNTAVHERNSRVLEHAVVAWLLQHPAEALVESIAKVQRLLRGRTELNGYVPRAAVFGPYRWLVPLAGGWLFANVAWLVVRVIGRRQWTLLGEPANVLLLIAAATTVLLAVGDHGEETRFLVSVLPFLAAWPRAVTAPQTATASTPGPAWTAAGAAALVVAVAGAWTTGGFGVDAHHAQGWMIQAQLLGERQAWAEVERAYERAGRLDPTSPDPAFNLGLLHQHRLGDPAGAAAYYRRVLEVAPRHYEAHRQLPLALLASGRTEEAIAAWREFVPLAEAAGDRAALAAAPEVLRGGSAP
jgi:hypothetical protein